MLPFYAEPENHSTICKVAERRYMTEDSYRVAYFVAGIKYKRIKEGNTRKHELFTCYIFDHLYQDHLISLT